MCCGAGRSALGNRCVGRCARGPRTRTRGSGNPRGVSRFAAGVGDVEPRDVPEVELGEDGVDVVAIVQRVEEVGPSLPIGVRPPRLGRSFDTLREVAEGVSVGHTVVAPPVRHAMPLGPTRRSSCSRGRWSQGILRRGAYGERRSRARVPRRIRVLVQVGDMASAQRAVTDDLVDLAARDQDCAAISSHTCSRVRPGSGWSAIQLRASVSSNTRKWPSSCARVKLSRRPCCCA